MSRPFVYARRNQKFPREQGDESVSQSPHTHLSILGCPKIYRCCRMKPKLHFVLSTSKRSGNLATRGSMSMKTCSVLLTVRAI
jgi:hypothetical protein